MGIKKKVVSIMAAIAIASGVAVMPASATERQIDYSSLSEAQLEELVNKQFEELGVKNVMTRSTVQAPAYDEYFYLDNVLAPTPHYIAAIGTGLYPGIVNFYFKYARFATDYCSSSRFQLGPNMTNNSISVGSAAVVPSNSSLTRVPVTVTGSTYAGSNSAVIIYKVASPAAGTTFGNEENLHLYTSSSANGDTKITSSNSSNKLTKCIYAMGDLDKNGYVNSTDSLYIQKRYLDLVEADPSRTANEQDIDLCAFDLAADVDHDNSVTMLDVALLNSYLLGNATLY